MQGDSSFEKGNQKVNLPNLKSLCLAGLREVVLGQQHFVLTLLSPFFLRPLSTPLNQHGAQRWA